MCRTRPCLQVVDGHEWNLQAVCQYHGGDKANLEAQLQARTHSDSNSIYVSASRFTEAQNNKANTTSQQRAHVSIDM